MSKGLFRVHSINESAWRFYAVGEKLFMQQKLVTDHSDLLPPALWRIRGYLCYITAQLHMGITQPATTSRTAS